MKYIILIILIISAGCQTSNQNSYFWIQSNIDYMMTGVRNTVEAKGNLPLDLKVLGIMEAYQSSMHNIIDSIEINGKDQTLKKINNQLDTINSIPERVSKFFHLSTSSSINEFKIQLALLEYDILRNYADTIGIKDIAFDSLELRFFPEIINSDHVSGQLVFTAVSSEMVNEARMYVNGEQIKIEGNVGIVDIPRSALKGGSFDAKFEIKRMEYVVEKKIRIPENLMQN